MVKTTKTFAQVAEHAALDLQGREGLNLFDKLNKLAGEVEIGQGFEKVDTAADPAHCAVEADEDPAMRHVADFYIRNGWCPEAAAEEAVEREQADSSFLEVA